MPLKLDEADRQSLLQFQRYPGIDAGLALDLWRCGVRSVEHLRRQEPTALARRVQQLRGDNDPGLPGTLAVAVLAARTRHRDSGWLG